MTEPVACGPVPTVLIVHHSPSPSCRAMFEAVRDGAGTDDLDGIEVVTRTALHATAADVLAADAYLLGTPANIGYMSGALRLGVRCYQCS